MAYAPGLLRRVRACDTGLFPADTDILMAQLNSLVDNGSGVVVVEHDRGPGGGGQGGRIVAQGAPKMAADNPVSRTSPCSAERSL